MNTIPFLIMLKSFAEHPDDPFNVKFFKLREFQIPEWGKWLFLKWVCKNGLLWYLFQRIDVIIEHYIYWTGIGDYLYKSHIDRLRKQIAELEKQVSKDVKFPKNITYRSPALCEIDGEI